MRRIGICGSNCPAFKPESGAANESPCQATARLKATLQLYFHHTDFKSGQLEALLPVVHGRDVFVRMPTGGGKTICMFLPPLVTSKTAIGLIISPLVALIDQQVSLN